VTIAVVQTSTGTPFATALTAGETVFLFESGYANANVTLSTSSPTLGGSAFSGGVKLFDISSAYYAASNEMVIDSIWMLANVSGGQTSYGLTVVNGSSVNLGAVEVSGLGASPVVDRTATYGTAATPGTSVAAGPTSATSYASEIALGAVSSYNGWSGTPTGATWTTVNNGTHQEYGYQILSSSTTIGWSQTTSGPSSAGVATIAVTGSSTTVTPADVAGAHDSVSVAATAALGDAGGAGDSVSVAKSVTYYVSPTGSDSANGTTSSTPWQTIAKVNAATLVPGDVVLFEGGQTWSGSLLYLTGQGTATSPITIGSYGTGNATISNGSNEAIYVYNAGGYVIENLDITGISGSTSYSGIEFYAFGVGQLPAITIQNCSITGWQYGILIGGSAASDGWNGITLSGNDTSSNVYAGVLTYGANFNTGAPAYNHQDVLVENCTANNNTGASGVSQWTGSGIVLGSVNGGTITGCTAHGNGADNTYSAGPVGIWTYASNNVTIEYCLAYSNATGSTGDGDGFDLDIDCTNCVIQYCLAYSNAGAGILCWGGTADSYWGSTGTNVVRWNLCWGNGANGASNGNYYGDITIGGNLTGLEVYQNTCVSQTSGSAQPAPFANPTSDTLSGVTVRNNIFYCGSTDDLIVAASAYTTGQLLLQGNCYYSTGTLGIYWGGTTYASLAAFQVGQSGQEKVSGSAVGLQANPLLTAPSSAPTVTSPASLAGASGLAPQRTSPCAAAGLNLSSLFSISPGSQDFFGDPVSTPLWIGAVQPVIESDAAGAADSALVSASIPEADVAGSRDSIGVAVSLAPGDTAGAADSVAVSSASPLAEAAGAADAAAIAVTLPVADVAASKDAVAVSSAVPVADAAGADDSISIVVTVGLADVAGSDDADAVPALGIPEADVAGSADAVAVPAVSLPQPDVAGAAEALAVPAESLPAGDVAGAGEALTATVTAPVADAAGAAEALSVNVTVGLADEGGAFENAASGVPIPQADTGAAQDAVAASATAPLGDVAGAAEASAVTVAAALADEGAAADALAVTVTVGLGDVAGAADRLAVTAGAVASLSAAPTLGGAARLTVIAQGHLQAAPALSAAGQSVKNARAALSAAPTMAGSARDVKAASAALAASPVLRASSGSGTPSFASLAAEAVMTVAATAGADLEALWEVYMALKAAAAGDWRSWRMMRNVAATDGTAGFLYGSAYEAEQAADAAYAAWLAASKRSRPGAAG
jgi:hypothetical protein